MLYRIIQESLSNASRHGRATQVFVILTFKDDTLSVNIKDNGLGCSNVVKGVGLTSMSERVAELGGQVSYNTQVNQGFSLSVRIPKRYGGDYGGTY
ncbi:MAG TPA: hypothetical protein DCY20_11760 [Firmicutes bacterium]|nr:hypothetical protein [Bacillota bacterium]